MKMTQIIVLGYFHNPNQQGVLSIHLLQEQYPNDKEDNDWLQLKVLQKDTTFFIREFYNFFVEQLLCIEDTFCSIYFQGIIQPNEKSTYWFQWFVYIINKLSTWDRSGSNAYQDNLIKQNVRQIFYKMDMFCHLIGYYWCF